MLPAVKRTKFTGRRHHLRFAGAGRMLEGSHKRDVQTSAQANRLIAEHTALTADLAPRTLPENLTLLAQNAPGAPANSHLFISVTEDTSSNITQAGTGDTSAGANGAGAQAPQRPIADAKTPGAAAVSTFQVDDTGTQIWRVCSIGHNKEGIPTMRVATAWQNGRKPVSVLAITTETIRENDK